MLLLLWMCRAIRTVQYCALHPQPCPTSILFNPPIDLSMPRKYQLITHTPSVHDSITPSVQEWFVNSVAKELSTWQVQSSISLPALCSTTTTSSCPSNSSRCGCTYLIGHTSSAMLTRSLNRSLLVSVAKRCMSSTTPPNTHDTVALDAKYMLPLYGRAPFVISHAKGSHLYTTDGTKYLDFMSGVAVTALGHCDAQWIEQVTEQLHAGVCLNLTHRNHREPC
jgi:hypothetical protein